MAVSLSVVVAKDGAGNTITGGLQALTNNGASGPFTLGHVIIDGVGGTNVMTVKAASTAPVTATDSAAVVALRPDSPGIIATGTAGTASATVLTVQGIASMTKLLVTPDSVALPANQSVNVAQINGVTTTMGNGVSGTGVQRVTLASDSTGVVANVDQYANYETVAASQNNQVMGATGATGDYLAYVTVFPGTAGCGVVTILDNASTWGTFAGGGTTALPSLVPFRIDVGAFSTSGAWKITTGANVTCTGVGKFT